MPWFTLVLFLVGLKVLCFCQKFVPCIFVLPLSPQPEQCCDTLRFCKAAQQFKYLYMVSTVNAAEKVKVKDVQGVFFCWLPRSGMAWEWPYGAGAEDPLYWGTATGSSQQWTPRTEHNRRNFWCSYSHLPICSLCNFAPAQAFSELSDSNLLSVLFIHVICPFNTCALCVCCQIPPFLLDKKYNFQYNITLKYSDWSSYC